MRAMTIIDAWTRMHRVVGFLCLLFLTLGAGDSPSSIDLSERIEVGQTLRLSMPGGDVEARPLTFELLVGSVETVAIDSRSLDFDTYITVQQIGEDGFATTVAEDDDGGTGTNSRAVITTVKNGRYRIEVRPAEMSFCGGEFVLEVSRSVENPPAEEDDSGYWEAVEQREESSQRAECRVEALLRRALNHLRDHHRLDLATTYATGALDLAAQQLGKGHLLEARSLELIADVHSENGRWMDARPLYEQSLSIGQTRLPSDHLLLASLHDKVASTLIRLASHEPAREHIEQALAIRRTSLPEHHDDVQATLALLAELLGTLGELSRQHDLLMEILAVQRETLGESHHQTALTYSDLGVVQKNLALYADAKGSFDRALAIHEDASEPDMEEISTVLNNRGVVLREIGSYAEADRDLKRSIALFEGLRGAGHPDLASRLNNLGSLYHMMGRDSEAIPLLERALRILEAHLPEDHPRIALVLNNLAAAQARTSGADISLGSYRRAALALQKAYPGGHPATAVVLANLASALHASGATAEATDLFRQAAGMQERHLGADDPRLADTLEGLSLALAREGDTRAAFSQGLRGEKIGRRHLRLVLGALVEEHALRYAAVRSSSLDIVVSLALGGQHDGTMVAEAWTAVTQSRALVLDEMARRNRATAFAARLVELKEKRDRSFESYHFLRRRPPEEMDDTYAKLLEQSRSEMERAEGELAIALRPLSGAAPSEPTLEAIAGALPPGTALIAYLLYDRHDLTPEGGGAPVPSYLAFVLGTGHQPVAVPLGTREEIDSSIEDWRRRVEGVGHGVVPLAEEEQRTREAGRRVREKIWDLPARHVGHASTVFIVPDGALNLVSFAALPAGDSQYLIESGPVLHLLGAERDLLEHREPRVARGLLVLGDIAFDDITGFAALRPSGTPTVTAKASDFPAPDPARPHRGMVPPCAGLASNPFHRLPASLRETEAIVELWRRATSTGAAQAPRAAIHLVGSEASEAAFKSHSPGKRVLHLATHAFFLGDGCPSVSGYGRGISSLVPAGDQAAEVSAGFENPLVLSGLALAGANHHAAAGPEEEDGILTAREIASQDLDGVEWAVLSACQTGLGEIRPGEGVLGLRRAFAVAGAATVIMSLWAVEDEAAQEWMQELYTARLLRSMSTADAVRTAGREVLRRRRENGRPTDPFFWAPFVAAGRWE